MFGAEVDQSRKLVTVKYAEHVAAEELKLCAEQIRFLVDGLPFGFRILADLSRLESMDLECVPYLEQIMDLCNQKGVAKVVRVIPDPHKDIGLGILSIFHYRSSVVLITCANLEEARKVLAG